MTDKPEILGERPKGIYLPFDGSPAVEIRTGRKFEQEAWRTPENPVKQAALEKSAYLSEDVFVALEAEETTVDREGIADVLPPRVLDVEAYTHPSYRKVFRRGHFVLTRFDDRLRRMGLPAVNVPRETRAALLAEYFVWYIEPRGTRPADWPKDDEAFCVAWGCRTALLRSVLRTAHFDLLLERYRPQVDERERVWQVDDVTFAKLMECGKLSAEKVPGYFSTLARTFYERMGMTARARSALESRSSAMVEEDAPDMELSERMKRLLPYAEKLGLIPQSGPTGGQDAESSAEGSSSQDVHGSPMAGEEEPARPRAVAPEPGKASRGAEGKVGAGRAGESHAPRPDSHRGRGSL